MTYFSDGGIFSGVPVSSRERQERLVRALLSAGANPETLATAGFFRGPAKNEILRAAAKMKRAKRKQQRQEKQQTYRAALKDSRAVGPTRGMYRAELRNWKAGHVHGIDDARGVYSISGIDDARGVYPINGLGEVPPGTSEKDKKKARKSFYYLYSLATMEPVFRKQAGIATGIGVAGIVAAIATGGLSLIASGGAAAAGAIMAAGTENCVMETTLWWQRSKKDRDAYIKSAFVGDDVKERLRRAAARMDDATRGVKDPLARQRARARRYFQDFIAVGPQAALKSLNADQQAAFGYAYLNALAAGKNVQQALAAGNANAASAAAAQAKANKALQMKQLKEKIAESRRKHQEELIAKAKAAASAAARKKAAIDKLNAARRKIGLPSVPAAPPAPSPNSAIPSPTPPPPPAVLPPSTPPAVVQEIRAAEAEAQAAHAAEVSNAQQAKVAEQNVAAATADEQKAAAAVVAADKEAVAAQEPPAAEKAEAAETDSDEDKEADKVADKLAPVATATSTTADADKAKEKAAPAAGGGGGIFPIIAAAGALALGAPALPVVGAAAALAFVMRKK